jgi:hypothetical protein
MVEKNTKDTIIPLEWKQQNSNVRIEVLEIKYKDDKKATSLLYELCSKNIPFSIKFNADKQYLILYNFQTKDLDLKRRNELIRYLKKTYPLQELTDKNSIFNSKFKKITQKESILNLKLTNNESLHSFSCLLTSISSETKNLKKKLTSFIIDLLQARIFSIVLTSLPSFRKNGKIVPMWGMMLIAESNNFADVEKKRKHFLRYISTNSTKLNCKLTTISKKDVARHTINFRFHVPWIKHEGLFSDSINAEQLLKTRQIKIENTKIAALTPEPVLSNNSKKPIISSVSLFKPFPSVKNIKNEMITESPPTNFKNNKKIEVIPAPSNLDDLTVPVPRTVNATFDAEYLKVRINKAFKEFDFKETVIFEDSFDLVLRKESFYIFVKFYQDILNQTTAYEIVDILSSIAGLRNDFLCIVVADVIEDGSKNILREYNVLHLTLNDVLLNDALKTKIYNTILV